MPEKSLPEECFSKKDLERAVDDLAMMPFFPNDSRDSVMLLLAKMCPHKRALEWLVTEATSRISRWPGPAELRGILCSRFDAADGIDAYCSLPGYSADEMEAKYLEQNEQPRTSGLVGPGAMTKLIAEAGAKPRRMKGGSVDPLH